MKPYHVYITIGSKHLKFTIKATDQDHAKRIVMGMITFDKIEEVTPEYSSDVKGWGNYEINDETMQLLEPRI